LIESVFTVILRVYGVDRDAHLTLGCERNMTRIFDRYEPDNWTTDGKKILSEESVAKIQAVLSRGPIIVQHWFYRGASCPRIFSFEDFEDFEAHLKTEAVPGDAFDIWSFNDVCKPADVITEGKLHDSDGCIPKGGAY
jgi:hypothetical protein